MTHFNTVQTTYITHWHAMRFTSKTKNYLIVACFSLFLFACAPAKNTAKPTILSSQAQGATRNQVKLYGLDRWSIMGKISIQFQGEAQIGSLLWDQHRDDYRVILYGPAGFGGIRIQGNGTHVAIKSDSGEQEAHSPEELVKDLYGWDLPVSSLVFWVKALPLPFEPFDMKLGENGWPEKLEQSGWSIVYSDYGLYHGVVLPTKMKLQNKLMKVTIKVQKWSFNP